MNLLAKATIDCNTERPPQHMAKFYMYIVKVLKLPSYGSLIVKTKLNAAVKKSTGNKLVSFIYDLF